MLKRKIIGYGVFGLLFLMLSFRMPAQEKEAACNCQSSRLDPQMHPGLQISEIAGLIESDSTFDPRLVWELSPEKKEKVRDFLIRGTAPLDVLFGWSHSKSHYMRWFLSIWQYL